MFLWFAGASVAIAWAVFRTPTLDYRLVVLGAVLPLADAFTGQAWVLHTLLASVAAMAVVMIATRGRGRRLVRRQWLGLPIGMFLHLVLDGAWTHPHLFWWPAFGLSIDTRLPEASRGAFAIVLECVGIGAIAWVWRRFELGEIANRQRFLHSGQFAREPAA